LSTVFKFRVRFVLRWPKGYKLVDAQGNKRLAWQITRGQHSQEHRYVWDARRRCYRKVGLVVASVTHPDYPDQPLWLVVARSGKSGQSPWYLLTNEPKCLVSALPLAVGFEPLMAHLLAATPLFFLRKFGMTHVFTIFALSIECPSIRGYAATQDANLSQIRAFSHPE
jgi:hypothetical protein